MTQAFESIIHYCCALTAGALMTLLLLPPCPARAGDAPSAKPRAAMTDLEPESAGWWFEKGLYFLDAQRCESAILAFSRSLLKDGRNSAVWNNRGMAYSGHGDQDKAISDFNKAAALDPDNPLVYYNRGNARRRNGDYAGAAGDYREALEKQPDFKEAALNLGEVLGAQRLYDESIAAFDRVLKADPTFARAYYNRGWTHGAKGDAAKAVRDFSAAIQQDPNLLEAWYNRGFYLNLAGEYAAAIRDFEQVLKINPDLFQAQRQLAWIYATCPDAAFRNGKNALDLAKRAQDLNPNAAAADALAAAHAELGRFRKAVRIEKQALDRLKQEGFPAELASAYQTRMAAYEAGRPWRDPPAAPND